MKTKTTKTDYKVGDRVQLLSISGIDQDRFLQSNASAWQYEVTVVSADHDDTAHDLLVECKEHDSVYWVDFANVKKLSRFGWIDGLIRNSECEVEISGMPLSPKPSQSVVNHSPDGFSWGYHGSGPNQLALAILLQYGSRQFAERFYEQFNREFIATKKMAVEFSIHATDVIDWMVNRSAGSEDHVKKDNQPSDKVWWLVTSEECECDDNSVHIFMDTDECECGVKRDHMHCYCGGLDVKD